MDISRSTKRLVIIFILAIVVILVSKSLLSKAAKNLSIEAQKKQQTKIAKPVSATVETVATVEITSTPADTTTLDASPQSSPVAAAVPLVSQ